MPRSYRRGEKAVRGAGGGKKVKGRSGDGGHAAPPATPQTLQRLSPPPPGPGSPERRAARPARSPLPLPCDDYNPRPGPPRPRPARGGDGRHSFFANWPQCPLPTRRPLSERLRARRERTRAPLLSRGVPQGGALMARVGAVPERLRRPRQVPSQGWGHWHVKGEVRLTPAFRVLRG